MIRIILSQQKLKPYTVESPDVENPTAPTNFASSNISQTSVDLTWDASTDNVGVVTYRVYNNDSFLVDVGNVLSFALTGLTASTSYVLTIRAVDLATNESINSNTLNVTTSAIPSGDDYTLASTKQVSIGVFDANDALLRTLVTNETKTAGTYNPPAWDGLDDDGVDVSGLGVNYKVVANAITDEWEGVIGNLSNDLTGTDKWHNQHYFNDGLVIGSDLWLAWGANEQTGVIAKTALNNIGDKVEVQFKPRVYPAYRIMAYDGVRLYFGGVTEWQDRRNESYVSSSTIANMFQQTDWHTFSSGSTIDLFGQPYKVADYVDDNVNRPYITGLAVQVGNENLYVAREQINSIKVLHKDTGAIKLNITSYVSPKLCKIDANGFLWFVHGSGVETLEKFTINNTTGAITTTGITLTGLTNVRALAVNDGGTIIAVSDASTFDQVKGYSTTDLSLSWTLGRAESYGTDATVYNDKFMFVDFDDYEDRLGFLAFQPDGSLWVNDLGNERTLRFDASRNYVDKIQWKGNFYSTCLDLNNPTRLFADYKEYSINYSLPILAGNTNNAWELTHNWGYKGKLISENVGYEEVIRVQGVETLSNGRTYMLVNDGVVNDRTKLRFVELVNGGAMRDTGTLFTDASRRYAYKKGGVITSGSDSGGNWSFYTNTITGFDGSNNPILGSTVLFGTIAAANVPFNVGFPDNFVETTTSGKMILYDGLKGISGDYHLAGFRAGDDYPFFKTTKGVVYGTNDPYPLGLNTYDARTDGNNNTITRARALDDWFIWNYYGEFWRQTQTNYWHMISEEGLFLYDFGTDGTFRPTWGDAIAEMSGNSFSSALVKVSGQVYLYHNDESWHAGVHRWKINGLDTIEKFTIPIS